MDACAREGARMPAGVATCTLSCIRAHKGTCMHAGVRPNVRACVCGCLHALERMHACARWCAHVERALAQACGQGGHRALRYSAQSHQAIYLRPMAQTLLQPET
eukprot:364334-Chlamydomonas_euryale.AAC.11